MEQMEGSTVDETIKSAISAFQNLFQNKRLKADEIEVSVMDPNYCRPFESSKKVTDTSVKHLAMSDIEDYLAAINKPISRNSLSVGKNMDSKRKDRREAKVKKEIEKYEASNPKITEVFADLKRKLYTMSTEDWDSIPDIGDYSRKKKKKKKEHMTAVDPKSRAVGGTEVPHPSTP